MCDKEYALKYHVKDIKMKYLWIGYCCDDFLRKHIIEHGGKFLSAYVSQTNITEGLTKNGICFDSINAPQVNPYPSYREKCVVSHSWNFNRAKHISVGYLNYKYVNHISRTRALKKAAVNWAKENAREEITIFVYSMHSPFMEAADTIKKLVRNCRIVLIVTDLPQFMDLHMSMIKKILKGFDWVRIKHLMNRVDFYVLYSRHMAEYLKLESGHWMVMEGSVSEKDIPQSTISMNKKKAIMYSGVCDKKYGIPLLLDAFSNVQDETLELWITGAGNAVDLIRERAQKDNRIKYFGYLPSRQDLLRKQQEAMAMINMRLPDEEASAYCFPSKIFEYMLSGNPVLSFRIPGIPEEYFKYLVMMEEPTVECVSEALKEIVSMKEEQRMELGRAGREFIVTKKNDFVQAANILQAIR